MSDGRFVLATFNRDKAREFEALLALPGLQWVSVADWEQATAPEETGDTLLENARIKARAALAVTQLPSLADDTGLEVDALQGAPGVRSARFAGPDASYGDNMTKLLADLAGVVESERSARFRTVCVVAFPNGRELVAEGLLEGRIASEPRGAGGFGYDPVFELPDGRRLAELTPQEKNQLSHRGLAAKALARELRIVVG
jgi:XTP/dITP diphosphohydrolase